MKLCVMPVYRQECYVLEWDDSKVVLLVCLQILAVIAVVTSARLGQQNQSAVCDYTVRELREQRELGDHRLHGICLLWWGNWGSERERGFFDTVYLSVNKPSLDTSYVPDNMQAAKDNEIKYWQIGTIYWALIGVTHMLSPLNSPSCWKASNSWLLHLE